MTPSQPESFSQFEKLLVAIAWAGVDFAVVGGVAVSLNGFVRATDDVAVDVAMLHRILNQGAGNA